MTAYALYSKVDAKNNAARIESIAQCDDEESVRLDVEDVEETYDSFVKIETGVRTDTHYINTDTGRANQRDMTPATPDTTQVPADGATPLKLSQMRDATEVRIAGPASGAFTTEADNASQALSFTAPGTYTITATAPFPAIPKEIVIDVTDN